MPILDATQAGPSANAYVTVPEADSYFDSIYGADDWMTLSEDDKARLLISATEDIDYITRNDLKSTEEQALNFPAVGDKGPDFNTVKRCCMIQALYIYENNDSIKSSVEEAIQNIKTQNYGKIQTTKSSSSINFYLRYSGKVLKLLAPYLDVSTRIVRS